MPDGEAGSLRLTYAQLAEARGISKASAERLVRNRKWPRVLGNDGVAIVIVPPARPPPDHAPDPPPDFRGMIDAAVAPIREKLDRAEQKAAALQAELVELRVSERAAADVAEYATGEAADLRKRLDAAEQRAGEERTRADRVEQQLTTIEAELIAARVEAAGLRCQLEQARPKPPSTRWGRLVRALGHIR